MDPKDKMIQAKAFKELTQSAENFGRLFAILPNEDTYRIIYAGEPTTETVDEARRAATIEGIDPNSLLFVEVPSHDWLAGQSSSS